MPPAPAVPRRRLRALALDLALGAAACALSLVGAEWVLRHYLPQAGFVYRLEPRCLYTLAPFARKLFQHSPENGGSRVLFVVNSRGLRGEELRDPTGLRIVVYGDSFVEAEFTRLEDTFVHRLERRVQETLHRDVEAVNAGVSGYGPDQSLRRFEDESAWLRPALVVLAIYAGNDYGDVLRNSLYRLDAGRLVEGGGYVSAALRQEFADAEQQTPFHLLRGLRRLRNTRRRAAARAQFPHKLEVYLERSLEMCREEYERVVIRGDRAVGDVFRDHYDADVALDPRSAAAGYKRALLEQVLGRWRGAAQTAGVPLLAIVVPAAIDVCDSFEVKVDRAAHPEYEPDRLTREAAAAAVRQGIAAIDLFGEFRQAHADDLYYRYDNDHWNAAGQDLAARVVASRLQAEGWLGR